MYVTIVTLVPESDESPDPDSTLVHDVIWALATPETGLQHVRVSVRTNAVDIVLFCSTQVAAHAHHAAVALCQRVCAISPLLHGWRVGSQCPIPPDMT